MLNKQTGTFHLVTDKALQILRNNHDDFDLLYVVYPGEYTYSENGQIIAYAPARTDTVHSPSEKQINSLNILGTKIPYSVSAEESEKKIIDTEKNTSNPLLEHDPAGTSTHKNNKKEK